jgi:RNA polymerase sigma-70 factor, ECF subfamily
MQTLVKHSTCKSMAELSEESLVALAKSGVDAAFEELMGRSWDRCIRIALRYLRNEEDAADEVQAGFWRAYIHLASFSEEAKFSTWVARIVINGCIMRLRSARRLKVLSFDEVPGATEGSCMHDRSRLCDPEQQLGTSQVTEKVRHELQSLPRLLRIPLELRHIEGLSLQEIGDQLGIKVGAVKTRIGRGKQFLRDRMNPHLGIRGGATLTR